MCRLCLLLSFLFTALWLPLHAQGDTITRNPKCVQLKRIWKIEGTEFNEMVGAGVGGIGDVNGDSVGDFATFSDLPNRWMVYYGARDTISTTPAWTMDSGNYVIDPVVGDFWGTGHKAVGFLRTWLNRGTFRQYDWIRIFRTDSNKLEATPSAVWYAVDSKDTTLRASVTDMLSTDIDGDGDDELIAVLKWVTIAGRFGQLWIYEGGPDFQVDTPSIVIKDPVLNDDFYRAYAGDIDGDRLIDLMAVKRGGAETTKTDFYWGVNGWPATGRLPDRSVVTGDSVNGYLTEFASLVECDGDGVMDVIAPIARIWRSGTGKDPHTRDWTIPDADIYLKSAGGPFGPGGRPGYLNSKRHEMVATGWSPGKIYFSGGPEGPDLVYDATFYPVLDGLQGYVGDQRPAGDVNGDGWDDAISGNRGYPDQWSYRGIALIIAGGPYIPTDDPAVGVRQIPLDNRSNALSLWPNPVRTELNIAWRGDLTRMPRHFAIHDILGRLVASGSVPDGDPAALWRCDAQPSGVYLLSILDAGGVPLATTRFVKE